MFSISTLMNHKNKIIICILAVIAALLVFQIGVFVGYRKAFDSYSGGDRFYSMMEGHPGPNGGGMPFAVPDDLSPSHGVSGKVVSLTLPSMIVAAPNNLEKTVIVSDKTLTRRFRSTVSDSDIRVGDYVLVLGDPDQDGDIEAQFIRITPQLSTSTVPFGSSSVPTNNR